MNRTLAILLCGMFFVVTSVHGMTIPKESIRALGSTKGRTFSSGLLFVNGRCVPPPYKVMRRGCGITVGETVVVAEVVPWERFCARSGGSEAVTERVVTVTTNYVTEAPARPQPQEKADEAEGESELDEVFGEEEEPDKVADCVPVKRMVLVTNVTERIVTPAVAPSLVYRPGDASKQQVVTINDMRTRIDKHLRSGGIAFFGQDHSTVFVDPAVADSLLDRLPNALKDATSEEVLSSSLRSQGIVYLPPKVIRDLYRHRTDYLKIRQIRDAAREDRAADAVLGR